MNNVVREKRRESKTSVNFSVEVTYILRVDCQIKKIMKFL